MHIHVSISMYVDMYVRTVSYGVFIPNFLSVMCHQVAFVLKLTLL